MGVSVAGSRPGNNTDSIEESGVQFGSVMGGPDDGTPGVILSAGGTTPSNGSIARTHVLRLIFLHENVSFLSHTSAR
jgi:hypothetical protein